MFSYLKRFLDATDPTSSLKHAAYAAVIGCSICWLTYSIVHTGIDVNWVAAYTVLVGAASLTKIIGGNDGKNDGAKTP